jgi:4-amino-4-deoxy-L-arabinose transferase-like glycosyltransferase
MRRNEKALLAAIVALALIIRLAAILASGASLLKFGDAPDYLSAATSLCSAGSYPDRSSMPFFRAPGLPLFIAATTLCHTEMIWLVKSALAILDSVSVAIVFFLAEELFRNRRLSLLSAGVAAVYPFFIAQVCDVQTEALFMFLLLAAFWLTLRAARRQLPILMFLAGACVGFAALVRPVGLILLFLLPVTLFMLKPQNTNRHRVRTLIAFAIGVALCLGPWIVRNEIRYHELILVNDAGGYNFWRGTSEELAGIDRLGDATAFAAASEQFETVTSPAIAREVDNTAKTPVGRNREWYRRAFQNLAQSPGAFALRVLRNAWAYWRPWLNPQTHSNAVVAASGLMVASIYLLALAGWISLWKRDNPLALCCIVCALLLWIPQIPFQVTSRFRIPITDPFLIIFAAAPLAAAFDYALRRR